MIKYVKPDLEITNVAVVGSCDKLLKTEYGEEIDSHENVIRFNRAPTEGFEEHVGNKTTLRIVNGHVFASRPFTRWEEDDNFVRKLRNSRLLLARSPELAVQRDNYIDQTNELFTLNQACDSAISEFAETKIELPTVGLIGIMLMVLSGIKPTVYGWSTTTDEEMSHYFNKRSPTTSKFHKWENEISVIQKLMSEDLIIMR